jgi:hypothetical protein
MYGNLFDAADEYKLRVERYERDWLKIRRRRELNARRSRSIASLLISALSLFVR